MALVARLNVARAINQSDLNPVGMIAPSMLTEAQFQALNGTDWVLADGRSVIGSTYATITSITTAPDLRSVVLRGKNNGRADGFQNPDGEVALGTFQNDTMQGHKHSSTAQVEGGPAPGSTNNAANAGPYSARTNLLQTVMDGYAADGGNGTPRTSTESRMRNVTVNYFIKIN